MQPKRPSARMNVCVRGNWIQLETTAGARPTPFSMFMAHFLHVQGQEVAVDAGSGCGVLAIALAHAGVSRVLAIERSVDACSLIELNAELNGVKDRIEVVHDDIHTWGQTDIVDLVVSNPPTVPETGNSPCYISGAGMDGLDFLRALVVGSARWLKRSGRLQVIVSSLVDFSMFETWCSSLGLASTVVATSILPLRSFYFKSYDERAIAKFVSAGQLLVEDNVGLTQLSEVIAVYSCTKV